MRLFLPKRVSKMNKTPHKRKLRWHMVKYLNGTYSVQNNNAPYWHKIGRWINIGWSWKKKGKEWIQCALGIWLIAFNQTHCSCSIKEEGNLLNYLHSTLMNGSKLFGLLLSYSVSLFSTKSSSPFIIPSMRLRELQPFIYNFSVWQKCTFC